MNGVKTLHIGNLENKNLFDKNIDMDKRAIRIDSVRIVLFFFLNTTDYDEI